MKEIEKLSYEEALDELEKILEALEKDHHTLEESLEMFKRGIELYKYCNNILSKTEGEIKILLDEDKSLDEYDFIKEEDQYY